jgi:hypothetical protein
MRNDPGRRDWPTTGSVCPSGCGDDLFTDLAIVRRSILLESAKGPDRPRAIACDAGVPAGLLSGVLAQFIEFGL